MVKVLILVLMDDALVRFKVNNFETAIYVLILVLMDDALVHNDTVHENNKYCVS